MGRVWQRHGYLSVLWLSLALMTWRLSWVIAVLTASLIYVWPHAWMARRYFQSNQRQPQQILRSLYRLEAGKILFSAMGFAWVFGWLSPHPACFFAVYTSHMIFGWWWMQRSAREL